MPEERGAEGWSAATRCVTLREWRLHALMCLKGNLPGEGSPNAPCNVQCPHCTMGLAPSHIKPLMFNKLLCMPASSVHGWM